MDDGVHGGCSKMNLAGETLKCHSAVAKGDVTFNSVVPVVCCN